MARTSRTTQQPRRATPDEVAATAPGAGDSSSGASAAVGGGGGGGEQQQQQQHAAATASTDQPPQQQQQPGAHASTTMQQQHALASSSSVADLEARITTVSAALDSITADIAAAEAAVPKDSRRLDSLYSREQVMLQEKKLLLDKLDRALAAQHGGVPGGIPSGSDQTAPGGKRLAKGFSAMASLAEVAEMAQISETIHGKLSPSPMSALRPPLSTGQTANPNDINGDDSQLRLSSPSRSTDYQSMQQQIPMMSVGGPITYYTTNQSTQQQQPQPPQMQMFATNMPIRPMSISYAPMDTYPVATNPAGQIHQRPPMQTYPAQSFHPQDPNSMQYHSVVQQQQQQQQFMDYPIQQQPQMFFQSQQQVAAPPPQQYYQAYAPFPPQTQPQQQQQQQQTQQQAQPPYQYIMAPPVANDQPLQTQPQGTPTMTPPSVRKRSKNPIGTQIYHCPHEGCTQVFTFQSKLKSHIITHGGEKKFICETCGVSFRRNHDLNRHVRTRHSEARPHICENCGKGFARGDTLRKHRGFCMRGGVAATV